MSVVAPTPAQVDSARGDWAAAAAHARAALATNADCLQARNLLAAVLRRSGEEGEAAGVVAATRQLDPLDWWTAHLEGGGAALTCDTQTALDVALDYAGAGGEQGRERCSRAGVRAKQGAATRR